MATTVRLLRSDETRTFLEVHHASIHGLARADYPAEVIEAWAPPITDAFVEKVRLNTDGEIRLAAEADGVVVGIGALVPQISELRACYVLPAASGMGVGSALVGEIERIALEKDLRFLELSSSLNAERFYLRHGYRTLGRGEHILRNGLAMACVKMRKEFV